MISALSSASQGMESNQQAFTRHADRISRWGSPQAGVVASTDSVDLPLEMVGLLQARRGFEANLSVVRAADEMLGSLLDILA